MWLFGLVRRLWETLGTCHQHWLSLHPADTSSPGKEPSHDCGKGWNRLSFHTNHKLPLSLLDVLEMC